MTAFIPLFVAFDPLGMVPIFLGITSHLSEAERRAVTNQATMTAAAVCLGFMLLGRGIFQALNITEADFQIGGGLILLVLAARDLVLPEKKNPAVPDDVGFVPLGLPLIAGPAAFTTLLILLPAAGWAATLTALFLNIGLVNLSLRFAETLVRLVGIRGLRVILKIVSLLLVAFAVSIIRRGWQSL